MVQLKMVYLLIRRLLVMDMLVMEVRLVMNMLIISTPPPQIQYMAHQQQFSLLLVNAISILNTNF